MKNVKVVIIVILDVQKDAVEIKMLSGVYVGFLATTFFALGGYKGEIGVPRTKGSGGQKTRAELVRAIFWAPWS